MAGESVADLWLLRIFQSIILPGVRHNTVVSPFLSQRTPLLSADKKLKVTSLKKGVQYEFRVAAVNAAGTGQPSDPSEPAFARDPTSKCPVLCSASGVFVGRRCT